VISPHKQAGIVAALSTLAVVTALAVGQTFHPAPATLAVPGAVAYEIPAPRPTTPAIEPSGPQRLLFPVRGFEGAPLRDTFADRRGMRRHHALDIMAPRGTPVVAVADGTVAKLLRNPFGGITLYQLDQDESRVFYYAHLDSYAPGVKEAAVVRRGDILGFVGSTGNAPEHAPHLHFAIHALGDGDKRWWRGTPVNPYPLLKPE
jgi:murein DD-endopeptidase MepM/ murein hydrolase activator NlpD